MNSNHSCLIINEILLFVDKKKFKKLCVCVAFWVMWSKELPYILFELKELIKNNVKSPEGAIRKV